MEHRPVNEAPLHLLFCPVGSIGDLHPHLAVAREALGRGHVVTVLANELRAAAARRAGCEFVAVQAADVQRRAYADPAAWSYAGGYRRLLPVNAVEPMRRLHAAIVTRIVPGRTVVVASYQAFGARLARETHGAPTATLHPNPHTLRSARGVLKMPPPFLVGSWVARWYVRLQSRIVDRFFVDPLCAPALNAFRRELGLPPVRRVMDAWCNSPDAVLGLFPAWWAPPQPEWPRPTTLVGFPVFDEAETSPPTGDEAVRFAAAGEPPIVFTPGASAMHTPAYFAAAVEACRRLQRRGLLITPHVDCVPAPLPEFMHHARYAPFTKLLPHAAAVVHQAGIGTTAACLRAGVPQVCIPGVFNQPDTAERLRRLGVARTVAPRRFTTARLTAALGDLLGNDDVQRRCAEHAARFGPPDDAARRACDVLESLASRSYATSASG